MKIAIGCDHGGIVLKDALLGLLKEREIEVIDYGTYDGKSVDYPDYAEKVARAVASHAVDKGILMCGTGIGISIAANKVKGIRCAVCHNVFTGSACSAHNDANIISLGGRIVSEQEAVEIVKAWLDTPFEGDRHIKRIEKITKIENN